MHLVRTTRLRDYLHHVCSNPKSWKYRIQLSQQIEVHDLSCSIPKTSKKIPHGRHNLRQIQYNHYTNDQDSLSCFLHKPNIINC